MNFIFCGSLLDVVDAWTDSCISVGNDDQSVHARIRPLFARNVQRAIRYRTKDTDFAYTMILIQRYTMSQLQSNWI